MEHETLSYRKGQGGRWGWRFVDCRRGVGEVITNESEYGVSATKGSDQEKEKFELDDPSTLAIIHEGDLPGALWRQGAFDLPGLFWRQDEHEGARPQ